LNFAAVLCEAGRCLVDGFLTIGAEVEMGFGVEMDEEEVGLLASSWHGLLFSWDTSFDSFLICIIFISLDHICSTESVMPKSAKPSTPFFSSIAPQSASPACRKNVCTSSTPHSLTKALSGRLILPLSLCHSHELSMLSFLI